MTPTVRRSVVPPPTPAPVLPWGDLPSLHDVFAEGWILPDWSSVAGSEAVARRFLADVGWAPAGSFLAAMLDADRDVGGLTRGQTRGVLNVFGGAVRARRRAFYKSRDTRPDSDAGHEQCIVCGGPLLDVVAVRRGIGPTCYERVVQFSAGRR